MITRRSALYGLGAVAIASRAPGAVAPAQDAAQLDAGAARAGQAIDGVLAAFPARAEQRAALTALRDGGRPGALNLPNGVRWYDLMLQRPLGSIDRGWAEARLLNELGRLQRRATRLFDRLGLPAGTTGERYRRLWADPAHLYADSDAGRAAAVAAMNRELGRQRAQAVALLGPLPPAATAVTVRALNADEIAAGKGGYRILPTATATGAYVVDLKDIHRRPAWTLPAVVAHELLPGHMAQLPVEALTQPSPERTEYAAAFVEGWAIHAETLVTYDAPLEQLGQLHWLLFRVGRALVDMNMHRRGWTIAQARAKLESWQGEAAYFAPFDTELSRIAVEPGARAAEALCWLTIADRAALRRGSPRSFHQAVLAGGRKRLEQLP